MEEKEKNNKNKILGLRLSVNRDVPKGSNSYGCDSQIETQELHHWQSVWRTQLLWSERQTLL